MGQHVDRQLTACTTNMEVGSIVVASAGHIQEFAARVLVLNEVTTAGIKPMVVLMVVVVVLRGMVTTGLTDDPLRGSGSWVVPLVHVCA